MLSVGLIFLYAWLTMYVVGFLILWCVGGVFGRRRMRADGCVMAGLAAVTVYAQFFSLFYKVGLAAQVLLAAVCAVAVVWLRKPLWDEVRRQYGGLSRGRKVFYGFLFLLMAYGTSRGILHYDTGLYHAQSIRWLEEYGVVKGLGNLHCRLAYNSASFALSALYSFRFLGGQSYHGMAGFLALVLAKVCSEGTGAWKRRRLAAADFARLMAVYYLLIIFDEIDTGISGKTSVSVANAINKLSKSAQVFAITHQPIIASKADDFYLVSKEQKDKTRVNVKKLDETEKPNVLAQMALGDISDNSLTFAKELLGG